MNGKLIQLLAITFILVAGAFTVSAQLDDLPKLPHKKGEPGALPDLMIASANFFDASAAVVIKNAGKAPAQPSGAILQIYATLDPSSKVIRTLTQSIPSLAPGKEFKTTFGTPTPGVWFQDHARRIIIDPDNALTESNKRNNRLFSKDFTEQPAGAFPEGFGLLSDLTLTNGKFISPAKVEFCVKNVGTTASTEFNVRTIIFQGEKKDSGVYNMNTSSFNSLNVGEQTCFTFSFAIYNNEEIFVNRSRMLEILPKGPDGKTGMKTYFETAKQSPWSSNH